MNWDTKLQTAISDLEVIQKEFLSQNYQTGGIWVASPLPALNDKKIFKKSKGSLKLLNVGEIKNIINLEISFASKKAIEALEKFGGKITLIKK